MSDWRAILAEKQPEYWQDLVSVPKPLSDTAHNSDEIIRRTAYSREIFQDVAISFKPWEHSKFTTVPATRVCETGIGLFNRLPCELLFDIILQLDMRSLLQLLHTHPLFRQLLGSLPQYQRVLAAGLDLFCALLRSRLNKPRTLFKFDQALRTNTCIGCGNFGGFLSLLTWKRHCLSCLWLGQSSARVQSLSCAKIMFGLRKAHVDRLAIMRALPGAYSEPPKRIAQRNRLVSEAQASRVSGLEPVDSSQLGRYRPTDEKKLVFMACCPLPFFNARTRRFEKALTCVGCDIANRGHLAQRAADLFPSQDQIANDQQYGRDEYLEHFRNCAPAQRIWEAMRD